MRASTSDYNLHSFVYRSFLTTLSLARARALSLWCGVAAEISDKEGSLSFSSAPALLLFIGGSRTIAWGNRGEKSGRAGNCLWADLISYAGVARSRSTLTSFTAFALNKPSSCTSYW